MPLHMRIPKRGFDNIFARDYAEVDLGAIQKMIDAGKLDAKGTLTTTRSRPPACARRQGRRSRPRQGRAQGEAGA